MKENQLNRRTLLQLAGAGSLYSTTSLPAAALQNQTTNPTVYIGTLTRLHAVDATSGEGIWASQTARVGKTSPTVVDGTVFIGSERGKVFAFNAATGDVEWTFTEPSDWMISSPTVVNGTLYIGCRDSTLYAVDAASGKKEWGFKQPSDAVYSSPTVVDGTVYVGSKADSSTGALFGVNAATGEEKWRYTQPAEAVWSSPTAANGTIYIGFKNNLAAVDTATGKEKWLFTNPSDQVWSSPTVVDGTVYIGTQGGTLYAVNAGSGQQEWEFTAPSAMMRSSPTVANGTVFIGTRETENGTLYGVNAETGDEKWAFNTPSDWVRSSPTVFNNTVYFGSESDDNRLYAVDGETGEQQWAFNLSSGHVYSSPTVVEDPSSGDSVDSRVLLGTLGQHQGSKVGTRNSSLSVTITDTNAPINVGETLKVTARVTNPHDDSRDITVFWRERTGDLIYNINSQSITIGPTKEKYVELSYEDYPTPPYASPVGIIGETPANQNKLEIYAALSGDIPEGSTLEDSILVTINGDTEENSELTAEITSTNSPVNAGELLKVTAEIQNTGDQEVTQDVQLIVGNDPQQVDSQSVTVGSGQTKTVTLGFETADVDNTQEFPVRVEVGDNSAKRTVKVASRDQASQGPTFDFTGCKRVNITGSFQKNDILTTTVITPTNADNFDSITPGASDSDHFFLEIGKEVEAPFSGTIAFELGEETNYRRESDGTVVNVEPDPDGGRGIIHTAQVWATDRADAWDPSTHTRNPDLDTCQSNLWNESDGDETDQETPFSVLITETNTPINSGERLEVTVLLSNPNGENVSQDVRLIVGHDPQQVDSKNVTIDANQNKEISLGYQTPAVDNTQEFPVRVKVGNRTDQQTVTVYGTQGSENRDDSNEGNEASLSVSVTGTNAPVDAGNRLTVSAQLQNTGSEAISETVRLIVGNDPEQVDSRSISVPAGGTKTVTLGYETYPAEQDTSFPVRIQGASNSDQRTVTVYGTG